MHSVTWSQADVPPIIGLDAFGLESSCPQIDSGALYMGYVGIGGDLLILSIWGVCVHFGVVLLLVVLSLLFPPSSRLYSPHLPAWPCVTYVRTCSLNLFDPKRAAIQGQPRTSRELDLRTSPVGPAGHTHLF